MIEVMAFRAFITTYSLLKSKPLNINLKRTLHKALIRSIMTYACPAWEFASYNSLLKLQRVQKKVLCTIGNFLRHKSVCELHKAFNILYIYDYNKVMQETSKIMELLMSAI
jgi:hypothetical protein